MNDIVAVVLIFIIIIGFLFFHYQSTHLRMNPKRQRDQRLPTFPPLPSLSTIPQPDFLQRQYTWAFEMQNRQTGATKSVDFEVNLEISSKKYTECKRRHRNLFIWHYHVYAQNPTREVWKLARYFTEKGEKYQFSAYHQVCNVLTFVQQSIRYTRDICTKTGDVSDYPKYPLETLVEGTGDCEDTVILAAAILACMGFKVAVLMAPRHAALGVAGIPNLSGAAILHTESNVSYFFAETTGLGWTPGQVPSEFRPDFQNNQFVALPVILKNESQI